MEQRALFENGPMVSALGLGTWPIGGGMGQVDKNVSISIIRSAIDQGMTLIDTAQGYRDSETIIGEALQNGYRERCFLATKASRDFSAKGIIEALENSLKQMRVEAVDLYQIHHWSDAYPIEETMDALAQVQRAGKAWYVGVSNYNASQMQAALQIAPYQTNQIAYHLFARQIESDVIPFCEKHGIGILAHSVLGKGLLTGKYTPGYQFPPDDERSTFAQFQNPSFSIYLSIAEQLRAIANDLNLTMVQFSIAWVLQQPVVCSALVGAKTPKQIEEYLGGANIKLSQSDLERVDAVLQNLQGVVPM